MRRACAIVRRMEERHWLRHPSLHGHQGPYAKKDLAEAIENGSFPLDSYVLRDAGQNLQDRQTSVEWFPVTQLLGLEPPKSAAAPKIVEPPQPPTAAERLLHLRKRTAYTTLRTLIVVCQLILLIGTLVVALAGARGADGAIAFVAWILQAVVVIVAGMLLQALLDIADHSVWTTPHPHDHRPG